MLPAQLGTGHAGELTGEAGGVDDRDLGPDAREEAAGGLNDKLSSQRSAPGDRQLSVPVTHARSTRHVDRESRARCLRVRAADRQWPGQLPWRHCPGTTDLPEDRAVPSQSPSRDCDGAGAGTARLEAGSLLNRGGALGLAVAGSLEYTSVDGQRPAVREVGLLVNARLSVNCPVFAARLVRPLTPFDSIAPTLPRVTVAEFS